MKVNERNERIEDLKYQIDKIDGRTPFWNIGNRLYGLAGLTLALFITYKIHPLAGLTIPFAVEMTGDIITGKHHFLSYRLFKLHPKYELERLIKQN